MCAHTDTYLTSVVADALSWRFLAVPPPLSKLKRTHSQLSLFIIITVIPDTPHPGGGDNWPEDLLKLMHRQRTLASQPSHACIVSLCVSVLLQAVGLLTPLSQRSQIAPLHDCGAIPLSAILAPDVFIIFSLVR